MISPAAVAFEALRTVTFEGACRRVAAKPVSAVPAGVAVQVITAILLVHTTLVFASIAVASTDATVGSVSTLLTVWL